MWSIEVDQTKCNGCGQCLDGCPGDVYEITDKKAIPVHIDQCHGCHTCEELCDSEAITINENEQMRREKVCARM